MNSCNRNFSSIVVDGDDRAPNRSMLRAVGFEDEDFKTTGRSMLGLEYGNSM